MAFVASDGREPLLLCFPSLQVEQVFFVMEGSVDSVLDLEYSYTLSTSEVSVFCFPNQTSPCCCGHISHSVLPCGARLNGCRKTCRHTGWNAGSKYPLTSSSCYRLPFHPPAFFQAIERCRAFTHACTRRRSGAAVRP